MKYTKEQRQVFAQYEGRIRVAKRYKDTTEASRLKEELDILKCVTKWILRHVSKR